MRQRIPLVLLCCLLSLTSSAQSEPMPRLDAVDDYFDQVGNFSFSFLRYRWRGINWAYQSLSLNSLPLNSIIDGTAPFSAMGSLGSIATKSRTANTLQFDFSDPLMGIAGGQYFTIDPSAEEQGGYATAAISSRTYTYRLSAGYALPERNGWSILADGSRRWGRSLSIEGVATDSWGVALSASRSIGRSNTLQITALYNPSERLMPSSSTAEAFALSGNNLYNPAWGVQNGRQRSVNVRRSNEPIVMVNHNYHCDSGIEINSGAYIRFGQHSYSGLNWQGAPNPRPDYYRYLPSAAKSLQEAEEITALWKSDVNVRQINFSELYRINSLAADRARYIIEDRVTAPLVIVAGSRLVGRDYAVGLTLGYESERNYKQVNSLLGANYWLDVDSFVEQDEDVKEKNQNNVRNPNRHIGVGEKFGYDYSISAFKAAIDGAYTHSWGNFNLSAAGMVALRSLQREGYYEKENFPLGESFGASQGVVGVDWMVRAAAEYRLGTRLMAGVAMVVNSSAPTVDQQFISPRYRNELTPNIANATTIGIEARGSFASSALRLTGSVYYYHTDNVSSVRNFYDDMHHSYLHLVTRNAEIAHYGIEATAEILLVGPLWLNVALLLSNNVYTNDPLADSYLQNTGERIIDGEPLLYTDLHVGGAPQNLGVLSLNYRPNGWVVSLSATFFDAGYAQLSPITHTARAMRAAASDEALLLMRHQQRLPGGVSVDLFGGYTHRFTRGGSIGIYGGINNLLSNPNFITSARQSDRFFSSSDQLTPQPSRYYYALPINFFLNLTYRF